MSQPHRSEIERGNSSSTVNDLSEMVPKVPFCPRSATEEEVELDPSIYSILETRLKKSLQSMWPRSKNTKKPERNPNNTEPIKTPKNKRNGAEIVKSEENFDIELPSDFPEVDIDKLPIPEEKKNINGGNIVRKYSFAERLQGWSSKRTVRLCGHRTDPYFTHNKSNVLVRSYIGMVNFLLYEEIPEIKRKPKVKEEGHGKRRSSSKSTNDGSSSKSRKKKNTSNNEESQQILARGNEETLGEQSDDSERTISGEISGIRSEQARANKEDKDLSVVDENNNYNEMDDIFGGLDDLFPNDF